MSDGPHKSLPMRADWRKLAERADRPSFSPEEVAEAVGPALEGDWSEEGCDSLVTALSELLSLGQQGALPLGDAHTALEGARRQLVDGSPLRRLVIDHIQLALTVEQNPGDALRAGVENALRERGARGRFQVEEHFHRRTKNQERSAGVGKRIEDAISRHDFGALARKCLGEDSGPRARVTKNDDLDDGVRLP